MKVLTFTNSLFGENVFVVYDETTLHAVIIDPGILNAAEERELTDAIRDANLVVERVLLTHAHVDHCAAARKLATLYGVPVCASAEDAQLARLLPEQAVAFHLSIRPEPLQFDEELSDGQIIPLGGENIQVIATPGHTQGGVCFYLPQSGLLFSGDTLFQRSIGRYDLPGGNGEQLLTSIRERLLTLPDETKVLSGHTPPTTIGAERRMNPFL